MGWQYFPDEPVTAIRRATAPPCDDRPGCIPYWLWAKEGDSDTQHPDQGTQTNRRGGRSQGFPLEGGGVLI